MDESLAKVCETFEGFANVFQCGIKWSNLGWMQSNSFQQHTKIDIGQTVELQQYFSSASNGRYTQNVQAVFAPLKVVVPMVLPRVKQYGELIGKRVNGVCFCVLVAIATTTGISQVFGNRFAAEADGDHMVYLEGIGRKGC